MAGYTCLHHWTFLSTLLAAVVWFMHMMCCANTCHVGYGFTHTRTHRVCCVVWVLPAIQGRPFLLLLRSVPACLLAVAMAYIHTHPYIRGPAAYSQDVCTLPWESLLVGLLGQSAGGCLHLLGGRHTGPPFFFRGSEVQ